MRLEGPYERVCLLPVLGLVARPAPHSSQGAERRGERVVTSWNTRRLPAISWMSPPPLGWQGPHPHPPQAHLWGVAGPGDSQLPTESPLGLSPAASCPRPSCKLTQLLTSAGSAQWGTGLRPQVYTHPSGGA